jgi:ribosomal protein L39E
MARQTFKGEITISLRVTPSMRLIHAYVTRFKTKIPVGVSRAASWDRNKERLMRQQLRQALKEGRPVPEWERVLEGARRAVASGLYAHEQLLDAPGVEPGPRPQRPAVPSPEEPPEYQERPSGSPSPESGTA